MIILLAVILLSRLLTTATASVDSIHTGFNYGAFWNEAQAKVKADFKEGFELAKSLSTDVAIDSARLFTNIQHLTPNDPSQAFDAAVETKTHLLLGMWVSGGDEDKSILVDNELAALAKAFETHGQQLSDLILGLSVGSEDIHRFHDGNGAPGVSEEMLKTIIQEVRQKINNSQFARYMQDKPIGHIDVAKYTVADDVDFAGMTAYPFWNNDTIENGKASFFNTLDQVKQRAGDKPIWIGEVGWPFEGAARGDAIASADNMQRFWKEVGCELFGKYNTFWFELVKDTMASEAIDWALVDSNKTPRVPDLNCGGPPQNQTSYSASIMPSATSQAPSSPPAPSSMSQQPSPVSSATSQVPPSPPAPSSMSQQPQPRPSSPGPFLNSTTALFTSSQRARISTSLLPTNANRITKYVTETHTVYMTSLAASSNSSSHENTGITTIATCITVADVSGDGRLVPVATNPAGPDGKCSPPPVFTGMPYAVPE